MATPPKTESQTSRKGGSTTSNSKKFGYHKPVDYTSRAVKENISASGEKLNMELFYNQQVTNPNMSWLLRHRGPDDKLNMCLRGIMQGQEDFTFNIQNDYSQGDESYMGEFLNTAATYAKSAQKQATVFNSMQNLSTALNTTAENIFDVTKQGFDSDSFLSNVAEKLGPVASVAASGLGKAASWGGPLLDKIKQMTGLDVNKFMNSHFMSAADVVRRYSGSTVTMNIPPLDVYVFHNPNLMTTNVVWMVQAIIQQCLGDLSDAFGVVGLQEAPGGYKARFDVLNTERNGVKLEGTWSLTWAGYTIHNLLVTSVQVAMSKFNAMDSLGRDTGDPLYAKVTLTLDKATFISRSDLFSSIVRTSVRYDKNLMDASTTIDETVPDDNTMDMTDAERVENDLYSREVQKQSFTPSELQYNAEKALETQTGSSAEEGEGTPQYGNDNQNQAEMR